MNRRDMLEWAKEIIEEGMGKASSRRNPDCIFYHDTQEVNLTAVSLSLQIDFPDLDEEDADELAYDAAGEMGVL